MTIFITKHNVHKFAKIKSTRSYFNRDKIVIMWDELTRKQKSIAQNIDIDVEVQTSDPSSVPDKWSDSIIELEGEVDHLDIVKNIIANPSRIDVYDLLSEVDPPEPLILWWIEHTFSDMEYAKRLSDICHYGLFKADSDYLWGTIAFGVESGVGKFSWPDKGDSLPKDEQKLMDELVEEFDYPEKELRLAWPDIKEEAQNWDKDSDREAEVLEEPDSGTRKRGSSLFDIP